MPGGRPPKPIEVKRLTGNPGKRKLPSPGVALVPSDADQPPPVPLVVAWNAHGRSAWGQMWAAAPWLSPRVDTIRVTTVCRLVAEIADLSASVAKLGSLLEEPIVTPAGFVVGQRVVPNPAVKMLRDAEKQLDRELSAIGFDPSSRSKLGLAEVKARSILDRLNGSVIEGQEVEDADIIDIAPDA